METDKNLHAGHRERAVKKFLTNPDSFSDHELLEVLLFYALPRRDTNALAHRIIKYFGSLEKVFSAPLESLKAVDGVGDRVATELLVIGTMYKRLRAEKQPTKTYCSFDSVRERMIGYFRNQEFESFVMLLLDKSYKELATVSFSDKSRRSVIAEIPEIATAINVHKPTYAIISHNHPSNLIEPSDEDDLTTKKINLLCEIHGVTLVDHVIIAGERAYSYERESRLEEIRKTSALEKLLERMD